MPIRSLEEGCVIGLNRKIIDHWSCRFYIYSPNHRYKVCLLDLLTDLRRRLRDMINNCILRGAALHPSGRGVLISVLVVPKDLGVLIKRSLH